MSQKEDLRIRKSRANFHRALLQLLEEKNFEDIKVIDICKVSNLNRSTFYDHFNDKYELLYSLVDYFKIELIKELEISKTISFNNYILEITNTVTNYLDKNNKVLTIINNNLLIYNMLFESIDEAIKNKIETDYDNKSTLTNDTISLFYASIISKLCVEKYKEKEKVTNELKELLENTKNPLHS